MDGVIARRYAEALFAAASEMDELSTLRDQMERLSSLFESQIFCLALKHPAASREEKLRLLDRALGGSAPKSLQGLFNVALSKGRAGFLPAICAAILEKLDERDGIMNARVFTAVPLTEQQQVRLEKALSSRFQKQARLEVLVTPALLGGVLIYAGGRVLDNSVKGWLDGIKKNLLSVH